MELKVDGVSFDRAWLERFSTEAEFLAAMQDEGQAHIYAGEKREEKLKTVWALVCPLPEGVTHADFKKEEVVWEPKEEVIAEVESSKRKKKVGELKDVGLAGGTEG